MLRNLSVLPGFGGTNLIRAGVADDLDESIHILVITELYEKFRYIFRRPNTITLTEKNHVVDVGGVKEDRAETQTVAAHLATADEQVTALAVDLHMDFGDAAVIELTGLKPPVPPPNSGFILLDVERVDMDGHKPEMHSNNVCKYIGWNVINKCFCRKSKREQNTRKYCH